MDARGYKNIRFFQHSRFQKDLDIDGLKFDGIATYNSKLVLFQAKSNTKPTREMMFCYKKVAKRYDIMCECMVHTDRKGVRIYSSSEV
jgi:hypothetical protein